MTIKISDVIGNRSSVSHTVDKDFSLNILSRVGQNSLKNWST